MKNLLNLYDSIGALCATFITPLANLWGRIFVGLIFWRSGVVKFEDMEETIENFNPAEDGIFTVTFIPESFPPEITAYLATFGELVLPILLFLGLFTRLGAAGLLVMTIVIQFFTPGFEDIQHYLWMIILLMLVGQGGSKLSVDNLLLKLKN